MRRRGRRLHVRGRGLSLRRRARRRGRRGRFDHAPADHDQEGKEGKEGEGVMKAISLWQPWASLIAVGAKKYETRSWDTPYRGPLVICASKGGIPKDERLVIL